MPIRWDTLLARHAAVELDRALAGSRLRAVRLDRDERDLVLLFKDQTLVWRLHPSRGYLTIHTAVEPSVGDHPLRCTLRRVEAPPDERLIQFLFAARRPGPVTVIVELMTTQWNAVVTEGEGSAVRHLLWRPRKEERRIIGQSYRPPRSTGRAGAEGGLSLQNWREVLEPVSDRERAKVLVRSFAWTSPLNAAAFLPVASELAGEADLAPGYERWKTLVDPGTLPEPVVLELEGGPQPYPFPLPGHASHAVGTLLDAFAECARAEDEYGAAAAAAVLGPELLTRLERRVAQAARRVTSLEVERADLPDPEQLRALGDLILARYREVPAGATTVTLTDFDGQPLEVELDPGEPVHASASRYYERAAKSERAAERLPGILRRARAELRRLEALVEGVRSGSADENQVLREIGPGTSGPRRQTLETALPYRSFWSSGGLEIRVGRGARHNDGLTFGHSAPNDIWLHARHAAGAHVVLRWQGTGRPPARDLEEAATLAALHSKARTSGSVPVDWTRRKYVRKPRKSPPGQVALERTETLFVEPDASLLEKLGERPRPQ
jgi:predicted ribosome quality control (RQC) complex YloA/Tae2 family protein